jgi:uncharacterized membrane protein
MALELVLLISRQAGEASRALQALKKHGEPAARNAVVLIRGKAGQVFVFETGNVDPRHGALLGVIVGLLAELLGGSNAERVASQALSMGFPEDHVPALQASLRPGGSALVLLIEMEEFEGTLDLLTTFQGRVWRQALADDLLAQLTAGMAQEER